MGLEAFYLRKKLFTGFQTLLQEYHRRFPENSNRLTKKRKNSRAS
jgi:hypothetical protein